MSYILDALRRADAERERGRVPGLHTQAVPFSPGEDPPRGRPRGARGRPVLWLSGLAAVAAAVAWWLMREPPVPPVAAPAPSASGTVMQAPDAPAPMASSPAPAPAAPSPAPAPAPAPDTTAAAPAQPILAPPPPAPPAPPAASPAAAAPAPTASDSTLPRVADLDPASRSALPALKISGVTYAQTPALRMLIVDGKVLQEGQDIAPGLTLERIGERAAVLRHQGRQLRLTY